MTDKHVSFARRRRSSGVRRKTLCIPAAHGGMGADYATYALIAAEMGRHCGATALTFNVHVCSTLWSGPLADDLDMTPAERAQHD